MTIEYPNNVFAPGFRFVKEISHSNVEFVFPEWSPDGTILALGVDSSSYALWYKNDSRFEFRQQGGWAGAPIRVVWSSDGQKLGISCKYDGIIQIQNLSSKELIETGIYESRKWHNWRTKTNTFSAYGISADEGVIDDIKWTPKGMRLITAHRSQDVIMWDAEKAEVLQQFKASQKFGSISVVISPDGNLITTNDDKMLLIREVNNFENVVAKSNKDLNYDWNYATAIDWSPDGRFIALGIPDIGIQILDTQTWKWINQLKGPKGFISSVKFSPKGDYLACTGKDNIFRLWNCTDWEPKIQVPDLTDGFISFHPKESIVAISAKGKVKLWEYDPSQLG